MAHSTTLADNPFQNERLHRAYDYCVKFQAEPTPKELAPTNLVCARYLGHLLHQLHVTEGLTGAEKLAGDIIEAAEAKGDAGIRNLAVLYINCVVKTFKNTPGPTQKPSTHTSQASEDPHQDYMELMRGGKLDHRTAKKYALRRDDFRCAITGALDDSSLNDGLVVPPPGDFVAVETEAAHILPESLRTNVEGIAKVWTMIRCFIPEAPLPEEFQGEKIHRLENIMTLSHDVHSKFDKLMLWLKPVHPHVPHTYRTYGLHPWTAGANRTITFRHTDQLPPPNANLLALHALTCEVAHMSGAAEYVDVIQRDVDEGHLLAQDGSSAQLLASVLALVPALE